MILVTLISVDKIEAKDKNLEIIGWGLDKKMIEEAKVDI